MFAHKLVSDRTEQQVLRLANHIARVLKNVNKRCRKKEGISKKDQHHQFTNQGANLYIQVAVIISQWVE